MNNRSAGWRKRCVLRKISKKSPRAIRLTGPPGGFYAILF